MSGPTPSTSGARQRYQGTGTVLETPQQGPLLCLGVVLTSMPPQCGGPPIEGWDWAVVDNEESLSGTTWGRFHVAGFYDGDVFMVTGAGPPPAETNEDDLIEAGCPEPAGGWDRPHPELQSAVDQQNAIAAARREPDFAGAWIDYIGPATEDADAEDEILTLAFTEGLRRHEAAARRYWGGALCVVHHDVTFERLREIQKDLDGEIGRELGLDIVFSDTSEYKGVVELGVTVITPAARQEIDQRYGEVVVEIDAGLHPIP